MQYVKASSSGEIAPELAPKGESKSNGEIERAVQAVHGLGLTIKGDVERNAGVTLGPKSPVLAWLIGHVGSLITLLHKG